MTRPPHKAAKQAKKDLAEAKQKAEAKKKAAEEAARKAAAERASRSSERTTLSADASAATSVSTSTSTSSGHRSAAAVVSFLKAQVGNAYVMGATGPNAWDCSGLVQAAFKQVGVDLPRVSQDQSTAGTEVALSNLQVGDILYWGGKGSAYHVAVSTSGDGQYLSGEPLRACVSRTRPATEGRAARSSRPPSSRPQARRAGAPVAGCPLDGHGPYTAAAARPAGRQPVRAQRA